VNSPFWNKVRRDFPITRQCIYLGHASCGPIPQPVQRAIDRYYQEVSREGDFAWTKWIKRREEVRKNVARFMNADPSEITFTQKTSA
jgi:selenocysteine lyase/cysteine desulfurase